VVGSLFYRALELGQRFTGSDSKLGFEAYVFLRPDEGGLRYGETRLRKTLFEAFKRMRESFPREFQSGLSELRCRADGFATRRLILRRLLGMVDHENLYGSCS
jgi:hypothetical protein